MWIPDYVLTSQSNTKCFSLEISNNFYSYQQSIYSHAHNGTIIIPTYLLTFSLSFYFITNDISINIKTFTNTIKYSIVKTDYWKPKFNSIHFKTVTKSYDFPKYITTNTRSNSGYTSTKFISSNFYPDIISNFNATNSFTELFQANKCAANKTY